MGSTYVHRNIVNDGLINRFQDKRETQHKVRPVLRVPHTSPPPIARLRHSAPYPAPPPARTASSCGLHFFLCALFQHAFFNTLSAHFYLSNDSPRGKTSFLPPHLLPSNAHRGGARGPTSHYLLPSVVGPQDKSQPHQ